MPFSPGDTSIPRDGFAFARHDVGRGRGEATGSALRNEPCQCRSHAPPVPYKAVGTNVSSMDVIARHVAQASVPGRHCEVCREQSERPLKNLERKAVSFPPAASAFPPPRHCEACGTATAEAISSGKHYGFPGGISSAIFPGITGLSPPRHCEVCGDSHHPSNLERPAVPFPLATSAFPPDVIARRIATAIAEAISSGKHYGFPGGINIPRDGFASARHDSSRELDRSSIPYR